MEVLVGVGTDELGTRATVCKHRTFQKSRAKANLKGENQTLIHSNQLDSSEPVAIVLRFLARSGGIGGPGAVSAGPPTTGGL